MSELTSIEGVLIDLGGVVYTGDQALEGATAALARLRRSGRPIRFLTNTTSQPISGIHAKLKRLGIDAARDEIFTPSIAARAYLRQNGLAPHFLVAPSLREDFEDLPEGDRPAFVIGDARDGFTYQALNEAFRRLLNGAAFVALANNRSYVGGDGAPCLDVGAFVAALHYASGVEPVVLGKPSPDFFQLAVADMGLSPDKVAMIGDDYEFDVLAAIEAGLSGVFARSGKAKPQSVPSPSSHQPVEVDDLAGAIDLLLS
ncbi:TIGR01458 family HAD-type hydrolase [Amorphus sp. 3PC139-8]|uniref:TIGR01458 family HAD-type hydrolase n=1 Tax=Amorphus sp. 3PC139-8 TaxID=2735676 RepID=UPI00345C9B62